MERGRGDRRGDAQRKGKDGADAAENGDGADGQVDDAAADRVSPRPGNGERPSYGPRTRCQRAPLRRRLVEGWGREGAGSEEQGAGPGTEGAAEGAPDSSCGRRTGGRRGDSGDSENGDGG